MIDRCRDYHHDRLPGGAVVGGESTGVATGPTLQGAAKDARDRECLAFFNAHPEFAQGYPAAPPPYVQAPYGQIAYGAPGFVPPAGYMMVPVALPRPCVETTTVTTSYVPDTRQRLAPGRRHHKDKRVYTGS
jgi:hypothetical protein